MSRAGTTDASAWFEQLFSDTRGDVLAYLIRRVAPADAADLLAEVYLVAWRRQADLPAGRERLWLFGAARRLLAQHRRQQAGLEHLHRDLVEHDEEGALTTVRLPSVDRSAVAAGTLLLSINDERVEQWCINSTSGWCGLAWPRRWLRW